MKLNLDLIRDILLTTEAETGSIQNFWYNPNDTEHSKKWEDFDLLKNYTYDEVDYHLSQCDDNGYFSARGNLKSLTFWLKGGFMVADLSPKGHEFINNIREDKNWKIIKLNLSKIGSFALSVVEKVAVTIINQQISKII